MSFEVITGETLQALRGMAEGSASLVICDPPYFKVKDEAWDNQWRTPEQYLEWLGSLCAELKRVLAPNGSLYLFASPQLARQVGNVVAAHFTILTDIRWRKPPFSTKAEMSRKEDFRSYFPASETIFFAEQPQTDYLANGQAFTPIKAWFRSQAKRHGITPNAFNVALGFAVSGSGMAGVIIGDKDQFMMPSTELYERMRQLYPLAFDRPYSELRQEYESLKTQYEALRRPFNVSAEVPYTDVWDFPTVNTYTDKHPCEKPVAMFEHIVKASSREGDLVLDPFAGSFNSGIAALSLNRRFIGIDGSQKWCEEGRRKLSAFGSEGRATVQSIVEFKRAHTRPDKVLPLFEQTA